MSVILLCKLATHNDKCHNCHVSVRSKLYQPCFCQILNELVYSCESYRKNKKGELSVVVAVIQSCGHNTVEKLSQNFRPSAFATVAHDICRL